MLVPHIFDSLPSIMLPWSERYRPTSLADVGGNTDIVTALLSFKSISSIPHLILHGPPGSGKTSSVLAMARSFFGEGSFSTMVLELNAGDARGVDTMRNQIQFFTRCSSVSDTTSSAIKMVILDEADSLSHRAQCALRHLIETSSGRVRFCLCCNYVSKLSAGLRSRCTSFRFTGLSKVHLYRTIRSVARKEGMKISTRGLDAVVDVCSGDARQAINLLQSLSLDGHDHGHDHDETTIDHAQRVYHSCGLASPSEIDTIFDALLRERFSVAVESLTFFVHDKQFSLSQIITPLVERVIECSDNSIGVDRVGGILKKLAGVERCLNRGGAEALAIGAVVGAFHLS